MPFAGSTVPAGYLPCDGSEVSRTAYAGLFAVIGTTYGTGDGSTTFNVPNLEGKVPFGVSSTHTLASTGGAKTVTLVEGELPSHAHSVPKHGHANTIAAKTPQFSHSITAQPAFKYTGPSGSKCASGSKAVCASTSANQTATRSTNVAITAHAASNCTMGGSVTAKAAFNSDSTTGGGSAHSNMQPYLSLNFIISAGE